MFLSLLRTPFWEAFTARCCGKRHSYAAFAYSNRTLPIIIVVTARLLKPGSPWRFGFQTASVQVTATCRQFVSGAPATFRFTETAGSRYLLRIPAHSHVSSDELKIVTGWQDVPRGLLNRSNRESRALQSRLTHGDSAITKRTEV